MKTPSKRLLLLLLLPNLWMWMSMRTICSSLMRWNVIPTTLPYIVVRLSLRIQSRIHPIIILIVVAHRVWRFLEEKWLKEHKNRDSEPELDAQAPKPMPRRPNQRPSATQQLQGSPELTPRCPFRCPGVAIKALKPDHHFQCPGAVSPVIFDHNLRNRTPSLKVWPESDQTAKLRDCHSSRQLPIAITFDPELRLTHGLRLREALAALFPSTTHANHGLGISEARKWRFGGGNGRLNMRTAMDCAWMLDGATKDRVWYPSRFTEPFWNEFKNFGSIESTRLWGESIRICTEAKTPHLKSIRDCLESTPISWP
ncbi:hypothetical protein PIB30_086547 [Stylosanthes scabra]|uniref:Uncharacterized protein n=1 Tax=Stylosanthes scabra TaxID=79078 RepID=A0ABU6YRE3_9FABA|nr:hypothetical protein [Stylosanthes scabra]